MIPNNVAEQLVERLVAAATKRHEAGIKVVPGMKFDDFIKVVREVGMLSVRLKNEGIDFEHIGMGLDYYSRAIAYMIDEAAQLDSAVQGQAAH